MAIAAPSSVYQRGKCSLAVARRCAASSW